MMHLKTLLLLAVYSNVIIAGVLRRGHFARSGVYFRSFNQSASDDAAVQPLDSVGPPSLSIPQATLAPTAKQIGSVPAGGSGPGAAEIDEEDIVSANTKPPEPLTTASITSFAKEDQGSIANTSKQIGEVPAVGSGPEAATLPAAEVASANTVPPLLSSTPSPAFSTTSLPSPTSSSSSFAREGDDSVATASKQIGIVPAVGSGPEAATLPAAEVASANTEPPLLSSTAFSTTSLPSPTSSSSSFAKEGDDSVATASKQIGIVPAVGSGPEAATLPAAEVASANTKPPQPLSTTAIVPSTTSLPSLPRQNATTSDILASIISSGQPVAPIVTSIPDAGTSNFAMAQTFNQFFDSMNANSACNPDSDTQRMVCVDKKQAECGADGKYTLSACSQNEICRAVPLDGTQTGIAIKCVPEADITPPSQSKSAEANSVETPPSQKTTLQAEPTKTEPQLSSVLETTKTKTVVPAVSALSSSEKRPPTVIITTQTQVVTTGTRTSAVSRVSPEPKDIPRASPRTSEQPAIVIVPESRRGPESRSSKPASISTVSADAPATTPVRLQAFNPPGGTDPVTVTQTITVTATVK